MSPSGQSEGVFVNHEIEVVLLITTTHDDIQAALKRSGITVGSLIGEALVENVDVYSPELGRDDA